MFELFMAAVLLAFVVVVVFALVKRFRHGAPTADPNRLSIGIGHTLLVKGEWLEYEHVYGKGFRVPLSAVQAATVEKAGWGKANLKVIGGGTELAKVTDLPEPWAENAQMWITARISGQAKGATV